MKEISISIIIIVIIISLDIITQNYTKKSVDEIIGKLEEINKEIKEGNTNNNDIKNKLEDLNKNWKEKNSKMAYYIEHDELEKVETNFTSMISYIDTQEYPLAINQIENNIFVLEHIKDKYQLTLENIF